MITKILKYLLYGILWGWSFFIVIFLVFDIGRIEPIRTIALNNFSKNVLASSITGIGFGTSAIVYTFERLRRWQQTLIHFGVGMAVYLPVALYMNWIPSSSIPLVILGVAMATLSFFLIWSGFYLYDKAVTKRMNERLKAMEEERTE